LPPKKSSNEKPPDALAGRVAAACAPTASALVAEHRVQGNGVVGGPRRFADLLRRCVRLRAALNAESSVDSPIAGDGAARAAARRARPARAVPRGARLPAAA